MRFLILLALLLPGCSSSTLMLWDTQSLVINGSQEPVDVYLGARKLNTEPLPPGGRLKLKAEAWSDYGAHYELTAVTEDGRTGTWPFYVSDYQKEAGSITIRQEDLR